MTMYWSLNGTQLHQGHVIDVLRSLATGSVQCVVTSPPYWGLRNYQLPPVEWEPVTFAPIAGLPEMRVAGCEVGCEHVWGDEQKIPAGNALSSKSTLTTNNGKGPKAGDKYQHDNNGTASTGQFCQLCGGWRGCLGLEPDPWMYVAHLVAVFREIRRVLHDQGTVQLNLGDSYFSSSLDKSSLNVYNLRKDLTEEEKIYVCMEMFGVRIGEHKAQGQGAVCPMLSSAVHSEADGCRSSVQSKGITRELSKKQRKSPIPHAREKATTKMGNDQEAGRGVCMLRGDGAGISDGTSRQQRRSGTQGSAIGHESGQLDQAVQGHPQPGLPERQIQCSVFQLQLLNRLLGILSAHSFSEHEIPDSIRFAFASRRTLKPKDLIGIPWRVAFALQADGWYLRSEAPWLKANCMPGSQTDRPTLAHESVFLLAKSKRYYWDMDAVREGHVRLWDKNNGRRWHIPRPHKQQ